MTSVRSPNADDPDYYVLRLFITGRTSRSIRAIAAIRLICDTHLKCRHEIEVIDLYQCPESAARDQIIAAPTLIKIHPAPVRRIVGDLADQSRVIAILGIVPQTAAP